MRAILLQVPETRWWCPNCTATDVTREANAHTRFHACKKNGLTSPMLREGEKADVRINEREDYEKKEMVQRDSNGRPIMSITVERSDSMDCAILAPTALGDLRE